MIENFRHKGLRKLYEKGEILNIIQGTNEVAIITNNKYEKKVIDILKDEKIINVEGSKAYSLLLLLNRL